jgi:hypothetical protein
VPKAQVVKRGEAICEKAKEEQLAGFGRFQQSGYEPKSHAELMERAVRAVALPPVKIAVKELAALPQPSSDAERFAAVVAAFEEALPKAEADPVGVAAKAKGDPFQAANRLAGEYGMKTCAAMA